MEVKNTLNKGSFAIRDFSQIAKKHQQYLTFNIDTYNYLY